MHLGVCVNRPVLTSESGSSGLLAQRCATTLQRRSAARALSSPEARCLSCAQLYSDTAGGGAKEATERLCHELAGVLAVVFAATCTRNQEKKTNNNPRTRRWCRRRSGSRSRTQPWTVSVSGFSGPASSLGSETGRETEQGVVLRTGGKPRNQRGLR